MQLSTGEPIIVTHPSLHRRRHRMYLLFATTAPTSTRKENTAVVRVALPINNSEAFGQKPVLIYLIE